MGRDKSKWVDMREIRALERKLRGFAKSAGSKNLRAASARALTRTVRETRDIIRNEVMPSLFTLRNKWTQGAVVTARASSRFPIDRQFAKVGVLKPREGGKAYGGESYLKMQEEGGTLPDTGPSGRRVVTSRGTGEGDRAVPKRRVVRRRFKQGAMNLASKKKVVGRTRKARAMMIVKAAREAGEKLVWLELPGEDKRGIFDVTKPKIKMVHRVYRSRRQLTRRPWLEMGVRRQSTNGMDHYKIELEEEIRRVLIKGK